MRSLILGAAGFLGINLFDALRAQGFEPRCGRRRRTNVLPLRSRRANLVLADLEDTASLRTAMADVDVVFHLAGHYPRLSLEPAEAIRRGLHQLDNVLDAAAAAHVGKLIYVSSTATVARRQDRAANEGDVFEAAPELGTYHALKWRMEQRALAEDRLDVRVACPSGCIGPWDLRVGTSALLVGTARGLRPAHPDGVVSLVDARDVADALLRLAQLSRAPRRLILSGEDRRLQPLLHELAKRYRVGPPSAPLSAAQAVRLADEQERRAAQGGSRPALSREIVDLIVHGGPLDTNLAQHTLEIRWRPLSQTLDAFDDWARRMRFVPPLPTGDEPNEPGARHQDRDL